MRNIIISKQRIWYENAIYHVMARSVRSTELFRNEDDYEIFFKIMQKTMEKYPFFIHSYCLMTTHFHMLITTKNDEIWKLMKRLMQSYAMYFNRKYGTKGHVFDSRYVSCLIEDGRYFFKDIGTVLCPQNTKYQVTVTCNEVFAPNRPDTFFEKV